MRRNLKEKILKKSAQLFSEFGFVATSMGNIAKSLNVTKAALYYHFKNKKELYLEVLNKASQKLTGNLKKDISIHSQERTLFQSIKNYLEWGVEEKNLIKAQMTKFPKPDPEIQKSILKLRKEVENQFEEIWASVLKKEIDLKIFISSLLGTMDRVILEAAFLGQKINIKKKASQILKILSPILKVDSK